MDASAPRARPGSGSGAAASAAPRWVGAAVVAALLVEAAVVFMRVRARVSAPFWYDEQWRAYHLSLTKGFWRGPQHINTAVAAGWVGIERASVLAFGNNEWALRLPEVLVLAAIGWPTWRVARHWVGVTASAIIAAAMVASGPLLPYAVQLKPYAIEALCCVVALLLWLEATDPDGHSTPTRIAMYAGIGLCTLVATPLVFAVAPLLAIDLARGLRSRGRGELLRRDGPGAPDLVRAAAAHKRQHQHLEPRLPAPLGTARVGDRAVGNLRPGRGDQWAAAPAWRRRRGAGGAARGRACGRDGVRPARRARPAAARGALRSAGDRAGGGGAAVVAVRVCAGEPVHGAAVLPAHRVRDGAARRVGRGLGTAPPRGGPGGWGRGAGAGPGRLGGGLLGSGVGERHRGQRDARPRPAPPPRLGGRDADPGRAGPWPGRAAGRGDRGRHHGREGLVVLHVVLSGPVEHLGARSDPAGPHPRR